jgi:hypothetical protein
MRPDDEAVAATAELDRLDRDILAAHATGDRERLLALYREAGRRLERAGDIDRACYYYTYGYVYALETGERAIAEELWRLLAAHGREA